MGLDRGLSKSMYYIVIAVLVIISIVTGFLIINLGRIQETSTTPAYTWTTTETTTPSRLTLRPIEPSKTAEEVPSEYFPRLYPWLSWRGESAGNRAYLGSLPRLMRIIYRVNVSVNMGGVLAEPLVEGGFIYLGDSGGVYALDRFTGELVWGVEVYSDNLAGRALSHPQPVSKWRALGYYRFVSSYGLGKYFYVATSSSVEGDAYLLALDKISGNLVWRVRLESEPNASGPTSITSNLVVVNGVIFVGSVRDEGYVFCVSEDGEILWRKSLGGNVIGLAYGDGTLYATASKLYAINVENGEVLWWWDYGSWPIYKDGKIIIESYGYVVVLNNKGELLWRGNYGAGSNVEGYPYIAVGEQTIYVSRTLGERPRDLNVISIDNKLLGKFQILVDEDAVAPIASKDVIILPVKSEVGNGYTKLYMLWGRGEKLSEVTLNITERGWWPVAIAAYGDVYVVTDPFTLYKLGDTESPRISNVSVRLNEDKKISVSVEAYDNESALHKVILVYSMNCSSWVYTDMKLVKTYTTQPISGYGYEKELYNVELNIEPNTSIEFYVIAIDNVGNYVVTRVYAYQIIED